MIEEGNAVDLSEFRTKRVFRRRKRLWRIAFGKTTPDAPYSVRGLTGSGPLIIPIDDIQR